MYTFNVEYVQQTTLYKLFLDLLNTTRPLYTVWLTGTGIQFLVYYFSVLFEFSKAVEGNIVMVRSVHFEKW